MSSDIISARFRNTFEDSLSSAQQHQAVDALKDYIAELKHGTDEQRRELGVLSTEDSDSELVEKKLQAALEKCYWQLVMFLRFSHPSRIAEAEPYLRMLVSKMHARPSPSPDYLHEIHTTLYLAAALAATSSSVRPPSSLGSAHLSPYSAVTTPSSSLPSSPPPELAYQSRDAEALALFVRAFALYDAPSVSPSPQETPKIEPASPFPPNRSPSRQPSGGSSLLAAPPSPYTKMIPKVHSLHPGPHHRGALGPKTELWARASYANLLRRLGRVNDAKGIIEYIRLYVIQHPYALPSEKYHRLLKDIEAEFNLSLLDATLSLETAAALILEEGEEREIQHVEDVEVEDTGDGISEGEEEDADANEDEDQLPDGALSPVLSIPSSSSSDSESAESSLENSPITPSVSHFPHNVLPVQHPGAHLLANDYDHRALDPVTHGLKQLSLEGSPLSEQPSVEQATEEEDDKRRDVLGRDICSVGYGAL